MLCYLPVAKLSPGLSGGRAQSLGDRFGQRRLGIARTRTPLLRADTEIITSPLVRETAGYVGSWSFTLGNAFLPLRQRLKLALLVMASDKAACSS